MWEPLVTVLVNDGLKQSPLNKMSGSVAATSPEAAEAVKWELVGEVSVYVAWLL